MKVGLTIDAVGEPDEFFTILDILNDYEIRSTFFCGVGIQPAILKSIYDRGHEIGSHTYSHAASYTSLSVEEKELDIPERDHVLDQRSLQLLDQHQSGWEVVE